jgi:CubicO group peptidase (beta-lactamase class C family)
MHPQAAISSDGQRQLQNVVAQLRAHAKTPGISVSISRDGARLSAVAGVPNTTANEQLNGSHRFELGYLSKFLVAILALELVSKGVLDLDAPIGKELPELAGPYARIITLRHLLSHTCGFPDENFHDPEIVSNHSWQKFCAEFNEHPLLFEPGTVFDYSQSASAIIGRLIQSVVARDVTGLIRAMLLAPMDIKAGRDPSANVAGHIFNAATREYLPVRPAVWCDFWTAAMRGPWLTTDELVTLGTALIDPKGPFHATTRERMFTPSIALPALYGGSKAEEMFINFGLGFGQYANGTWGLSSLTRGQCCALRIDPRQRLVVAVAFNSNQADLRDKLMTQLLNALSPRRDIARLAESSSAGGWFDFAEFAGKYRGAREQMFDAIHENESLLVRPAAESALGPEGRALMMAFVRNAAGRAVPREDTGDVAGGLFHEPTSRTPCIMLGANALRKF